MKFNPFERIGFKRQPESSPEVVEEPKTVADKNVVLMKRELLDFLSGESIGGNAYIQEMEGEKYSCAAANFHINPETGEIRSFTNEINQDPKLIEGSFLAAYEPQGRGFFRIELATMDGRLSTEAQATLDEAIEGFNIYLKELKSKK